MDCRLGTSPFGRSLGPLKAWSAARARRQDLLAAVCRAPHCPALAPLAWEPTH